VPLPAAGGIGTVLSTIAKLQLTSVPRVPRFKWSVGRVTFVPRRRGLHGAMQGVVWTLPSAMFVELSGRLTGSLAISFIRAQTQRPHQAAEEAPVFARLPILAHAMVNGPDGEVWVSAQGNFLRLEVSP
jgi:hypothetical protein